MMSGRYNTKKIFFGKTHSMLCYQLVTTHAHGSVKSDNNNIDDHNVIIGNFLLQWHKIIHNRVHHIITTVYSQNTVILLQTQYYSTLQACTLVIFKRSNY